MIVSSLISCGIRRGLPAQSGLRDTRQINCTPFQIGALAGMILLEDKFMKEDKTYLVWGSDKISSIDEITFLFFFHFTTSKLTGLISVRGCLA